MHLQQPVDVLGLGAGAFRDAALAAGLEQIGIAPLARRHRVDDRHLPLEHLLVEIGGRDLVLHLGDAGHHAHQRRRCRPCSASARAARADRRDRTRPCASSRRRARPSRRRSSPRPSRPARRCRPCRGCGRRCATGSKSSSASSFSPVPISLIGLPVTARIESAAPPRPSPSTRVSTMPVRPTRSSNERARLTASWPVSASATSSTSCGFAACFTLGGFRHHLVVERGAARSVEHHDVVAAEPRRFERAARDLRRRLARDDRQRLDADLLAEHRELLHRGRTARVERGHQHLALALLGEAPRDLRRGGGFARALQADHHDGDRRRRIEVDRIGVRAERLDQLVVHDLDDHLARLDRLDQRDADRVLLHLVDEGAHDIERDVGFEQRAAHFAQRRIDVGLRQRAAPGQPIENSAKPFRQAVEQIFRPQNGRPGRRPMPKHFRARGRIALSGGGRRLRDPVGELALRSLARAGGRTRAGHRIVNTVSTLRRWSDSRLYYDQSN